ncbi:hypothetical protein [Litoribacillus peritrichatus]|uniref:Uncharacterized protein n=1 Tax=Litoribacillus peritrichatus TaxID=718191 RepID=A0ABP7MIA9_9GAMM
MDFEKRFKNWLILCLLLFSGLLQAEGTAGLTGVYSGEYGITMRAAPTGAILGEGVQTVTWHWDFDAGTATMSGTTLSVGFNYAIHDLNNTDPDNDTLHFNDNGDGTYTLYYALQIYHPGLGNPMANTSTTFRITKTDNHLDIITLDDETGPLDGIPGTQIPGVFPLTIEPDFRGFATLEGSDSNNDGLTDERAQALGLDPKLNDNDGDGINDTIELGDDFNNPLDTDGDGVIDALEYGDAAQNPQLAEGIKLISGDELSLSTENNWVLTAVAVGSMQLEVDNIEDVDDIVNKDSTLGDPGLKYSLGNISFTASLPDGLPPSDAVSVRFTLSSPLPEKPLVYSIEAQGSGKYALLPTEDWKVIDPNTMEITCYNGSSRDIDGEYDQRMSASIAITGNTIGGVKRDDTSAGGGSFSLVLFVLLVIVSVGRRYFISY